MDLAFDDMYGLGAQMFLKSEKFISRGSCEFTLA
jgi:hypothetical protein